MAVSCKKFLDASPDKQLTTPGTVQDLRAILDFNNLMNVDYSCYGAIASDDYYVPDASLATLRDVVAKNNYSWGLITESSDEDADWLLNYKRIFGVNVVLDNIDKVSLNGSTGVDVNTIKGEALFYRAFTIFTLAQVYALPYNPADEEEKPGIPLRLTSDINEKMSRPSLFVTYQQITDDLLDAIGLLPINSYNLLRPSKAAAFGALANVYLVMQQFDEAGKYADSCMRLRDELIDFNDLLPSANAPIELLNKEVLWQADLAYNTILATSRSKVDSLLYKSYGDTDLRKGIYFKVSGTSPPTYKGHYNGQWKGSSVHFSGIAVDEMYLIKAECEARLGRTSDALTTLNNLMIRRYDKTSFIPFDASSPEAALQVILQERRKELCFRGALRWMDIRRLNQFESSRIILNRKIEGQQFTLQPDDYHYAFLIPQHVIDNSAVKQNRR